MQADGWWTHRSRTSAQVVYDDKVDGEDGSGSGSGGRRNGRWGVPISDNDDDDYYYTTVYYYDDYDASGSGVGDDGKLLDWLLQCTRVLRNGRYISCRIHNMIQLWTPLFANTRNKKVK